MKRTLYLITAAIVGAALLSSCGLLDAFSETAADPNVVAQIDNTLATVPDAVASGDWTATEIGATSVLSTIVLGGISKWLHGRMKTSGPGEIIGGKA